MLKGGKRMKELCQYCVHPDNATLRGILISKIIWADDATLHTLAKICDVLGIEPGADDEEITVFTAVAKDPNRMLRLVK